MEATIQKRCSRGDEEFPIRGFMHGEGTTDDDEATTNNQKDERMIPDPPLVPKKSQAPFLLGKWERIKEAGGVQLWREILETAWARFGSKPTQP